MSHISKLTIQGVKALDRTIELAPLTLITGQNGAGKTGVLESIRFLFLGYCPGDIGKTNAAIFGLCSGASMNVTAEMSDKTEHHRGLSLVGSKISETGGKTTAGLVSPCLDPELYFGLSESKRVQYIFERSGDLTAELSDAALIARVANAIPDPDPVTEEHVAAKREVVAGINKKLGGNQGVQEKLEGLAEWLRDQFKQWNQAARDSQGAVATLTELRLTSANVFATVPELERDRAALAG